MRIATIQLVLTCSAEEVPDAINEILREQTQLYCETSCLIDYNVPSSTSELYVALDNYSEGDAFQAHSQDHS